MFQMLSFQNKQHSEQKRTKLRCQDTFLRQNDLLLFHDIPDMSLNAVDVKLSLQVGIGNADDAINHRSFSTTAVWMPTYQATVKLGSLYNKENTINAARLAPLDGKENAINTIKKKKKRQHMYVSNSVTLLAPLDNEENNAVHETKKKRQKKKQRHLRHAASTARRQSGTTLCQPKFHTSFTSRKLKRLSMKPAKKELVYEMFMKGFYEAFRKWTAGKVAASAELAGRQVLFCQMQSQQVDKE